MPALGRRRRRQIWRRHLLALPVNFFYSQTLNKSNAASFNALKMRVMLMRASIIRTNKATSNAHLCKTQNISRVSNGTIRIFMIFFKNCIGILIKNKKKKEENRIKKLRINNNSFHTKIISNKNFILNFHLQKKTTNALFSFSFLLLRQRNLINMAGEL